MAFLRDALDALFGQGSEFRTTSTEPMSWIRDCQFLSFIFFRASRIHGQQIERGTDFQKRRRGPHTGCLTPVGRRRAREKVSVIVHSGSRGFSLRAHHTCTSNTAISSYITIIPRCFSTKVKPSQKSLFGLTSNLVGCARSR